MQQYIKKVPRVLPGLQSEEPQRCRLFFIYLFYYTTYIVLVMGIGIRTFR